MITTPTNVKIGDVLDGGSNELRHLAEDTVLIEEGSLTKRVKAGNGVWFKGGGYGWDGRFIVVGLPKPVEPPKPDLTDRTVLATEIRRMRTGDKSATLDGWETEYLRAADMIRENFTHNSLVPAREGDRVIVVDGDYRVGQSGVVEEGPDSDNEYYILFDGETYATWIHAPNVRKV